MKKFIFWILDITEWEENLRRKHYREVGGMINSAHYWFNGGFDGPPKDDVTNTLFFIGESLKENAWFDIASIRKKVYKMTGPYHKLSQEEIKQL